MEVEYVACSATTQDIVWLKSFLYHLKIVKLVSDLVTIYFNNIAAVVVAKDPKSMERPNTSRWDITTLEKQLLNMTWS